MSFRQYLQIKQNLKLWFLIEQEGVDPAALWSLFAECRATVQQIIDSNEELSPPSLWQRLRMKINGV